MNAHRQIFVRLYLFVLCSLSFVPNALSSDKLQLEIKPADVGSLHINQPIWLNVKIHNTGSTSCTVLIEEVPDHGLQIVNFLGDIPFAKLLERPRSIDFPLTPVNVKGNDAYGFNILLSDFVDVSKPGNFTLTLDLPVRSTADMSKRTHLRSDIQIQIGNPLDSSQYNALIRNSIDLFNTGNAEQKIKALKSLEILKPENLLILLKTGLTDKDEAVQLKAIQMLSSFDLLQTKVLYSAALASRYESVRNVARDHLK